MTTEPEPAVTGARAEEIARYAEAVREALRDLPSAVREELLEDLPAHLAEVAAEDPAPLTRLLGEPATYAAELRAALGPAGRPRRSLAARLRTRWEPVAQRLHRLDARTGPMLGYERASEFGRLLVPAWWVVRGYVAAMVVAYALDRRGGLGLLPRLGGSTLVGLALLAVFVAGSIWLAHRTSSLSGWGRRGVHAASAVVVLFGMIGFLDMDRTYRGGWAEPVRYVSENPYEHVRDVFVLDQDGRLLTGITLRDQNGEVIDLGRAAECTQEYDEAGLPVITYPRCPEDLPWWLDVGDGAVGQSPSPSGGATPSPSPSR